jgi:tetratricopeptide (TPR) repeat protein
VFSWSYRALDPGLRRSFRFLGLHPGPEFSAGAAAALLGAGRSTAVRHLRALADVHLLRETSHGRFRLHDLLHAYAAERTAAEETRQDRTLAVRRILTWYALTADAGRRVLLPSSPDIPEIPATGVELAERFATGEDAMRWFAAERGNLLAALSAAAELGQYDIAWKTAVATTGFFELGSYWADWESNHRIGLSAALALGDRLGEAANLALLADALTCSGRWEEAAQYYRRAVPIGAELSVGWIEGGSLRGRLSLSTTLLARGETADAVANLRQAVTTFHSLQDRRNEAEAVLALGDVLADTNDRDGATTSWGRAAELFEELRDDRATELRSRLR